MNHKKTFLYVLLAVFFIMFSQGVSADKTGDAIRAVVKNDYAAVTKYIDEGLDPNLKGKGAYQAALLNTACRKNSIQMVKLLLAKGADVNLADDRGDTPLMLAALHARTPEIVKLLVQKGADINAVSDDGSSILDHAVIGVVSSQGSMQAVKFLVDQGLDVDKSSVKKREDYRGYTVLMMAVRSNKIELTEYLISKGANVNTRALKGDTPLSIAVAEKHNKMITLLKKHGAKRDAQVTPSGKKVKAKTGEDTKVMIVLDASGSMWGQIDGKTKIQIAREVLTSMLENMGSDIQLGLSAYGHRRKGDCSDIETLIQVGKGNSPAIIKKVKGLNPKGKTPLSEAVRQAAKKLIYTKERATVVLISDGIETCNLNPCDVGAELAMNGYDFTAHVISFDVKKEEQAGLECLANNTGGLFLSANNARELSIALSKTVEKVKEPAPPIIEKPGDASLTAPSSVPAGSMIEVHWKGPASRNDFITIVEKDAVKGSYKNYAYTSKGNPLQIMVPDKVSSYEIRYVFGYNRSTLARRPVTVTQVQASLTPQPEVAAGSILKIDWKGPNNRGDYISLAEVGDVDDKFLSYAHTLNGSPATIHVPDESGRYEVRYITGQSGSILARAQVNVTAVSAWIKPPAEVAAGARFAIEWKGPNNKSDYITIVKPTAADSEYAEYAYTSTGSPARLHAPAEPGTYQLRYVLDQSRTVIARADFLVITVSASVTAPTSVKAGANFTVSWLGPNYQSDYITIVPAGSPDKAYTSYAYTSSGSSITLKAPIKPGSYEVRYIVDKSRTALARTPVKVK